jgi:uncharacterized protein DUF1553/uncharacterized protein DUF1549/cytochrome c
MVKGMQTRIRGQLVCPLVLAVLVLPTIASAGEADPLTPGQMAFFEQRVRPLLIEHCYTCHSEAKKVNGGLRLDSRRGLIEGGDSGPAISPGKPEESLLIQAVRYQDTDLQMPPDGKLAAAELAVLEEWVRIGAPDSRADTASSEKTDVNQAAARAHWAYQPLRQVAPPAVGDGQWPLGTVDRFVLAKLEVSGLHPSLDADRYLWLRRVSLDLTGLPPTRNEIQSFIDDHSPLAWEHVVDRLLASRDFGERSARPWLDLVGYADQIGSANNVPAEHAWRYRDYVIQAYRDDKPFDEFIREQLAGDLLTAQSIVERQAQITATGFLVLGNVNIVESDKLIMQMDLVDQQIEKVGKTFLGMTLNCARCHDHKFDPITLGDYYGLAGIFSSTESTHKEQRGVWSSVTKSPLPETLEQFTQREAALRENAKKVAAVDEQRVTAEARLKELTPLVKAARENPTAAAPGAKSLADLEKEQAELTKSLATLEQQSWHLKYLEPSTPLAHSVKECVKIADAQLQVRGNPHVLGPAVPRGFVEVATHGSPPTIPADQSGRLQLANWLTGSASSLVARVTVNRIWQRLFGRGLVGSVDYFGVRGELPTHPELLDYLAGQFIRDGWSQKRLIRELVLSHTYRQRAEADDSSQVAITADPENRLLWRMSPRRLDAEMLRDAVLAVSGELKRCTGGPALAPEFIENVGGLNPTDVNPISFSLSKFRDDQRSLRTIYLPVVRSSEQQGPAEVLNFFDFAQPARLAGDRPTTSVAAQALYLLNGPLLKDAARKLATELLADTTLTTDDVRFSVLYLRALGRPPATEESIAAREFVTNRDASTTGTDSGGTDPLVAWPRLIHALLTSNDFLFRL